jgi:hypothetical protein
MALFGILEHYTFYILQYMYLLELKYWFQLLFSQDHRFLKKEEWKQLEIFKQTIIVKPADAYFLVLF